MMRPVACVKTVGVTGDLVGHELDSERTSAHGHKPCSSVGGIEHVLEPSVLYRTRGACRIAGLRVLGWDFGVADGTEGQCYLGDAGHGLGRGGPCVRAVRDSEAKRCRAEANRGRFLDRCTRAASWARGADL